MATQDQILSLRLEIKDPMFGSDGLDIIQIVTVATDIALPSTPAQQALYFVQDTSHYKATAVKVSAILSDYEDIPLQLSDTQLGALIDTYGIRAACQAYIKISATLGPKLMLQRNDSGAESEQYASILDMFNYYRQVASGCEDAIEDAKGTNSGRILRHKKPYINGGLL